jgi:hypothetical protein
MSQKERIFDGMTEKEIITRCGELQLLHEQVVLLVAEQHLVNRQQLLSNLQTPGTDEYEWYQSGVAEGNLKLNINLEYNVGDPKAKDAYKHLSAERRRKDINKKLDDLFGL